MTDDRVQLGVEIDRELKHLVDTDRRSNRDVVEAALWSEFSGIDDDGLERRLKEVEKRKQVYRKEIEHRQEELEEAQAEMERLRAKMEDRETRNERVLAEAADVLGRGMLDPDNPALKNWADKSDLSPAEFIDRLRDRVEENDG